MVSPPNDLEDPSYLKNAYRIFKNYKRQVGKETAASVSHFTITFNHIQTHAAILNSSGIWAVSVREGGQRYQCKCQGPVPAGVHRGFFLLIYSNDGLQGASQMLLQGSSGFSRTVTLWVVGEKVLDRMKFYFVFLLYRKFRSCLPLLMKTAFKFNWKENKKGLVMWLQIKQLVSLCWNTCPFLQ